MKLHDEAAPAADCAPAAEVDQVRREAYAAAMAELIAHIAHEVNQPLAAIAANGNACARWLAADPPNIEEARAAAHRTVRDARRASDVIAEMRAFLSRAAGPRQPLSLNALVEACVASASAAARRRHVHLSAELSEAAPRVVGRASALRQALDHLVDNALEACLDVPSAERQVRVRVRGPERGEMVMIVEDSGPGFPPDSMQRMFEPLFSTRPGRLGLGLAVARSTFEDHGGRLLAQRGADGFTRLIATIALEGDGP